MIYLYIIMFATLVLVSVIASIAILIYNTYTRDITNTEVVSRILSQIPMTSNLTIQEQNNVMLHTLLKNLTK